METVSINEHFTKLENAYNVGYRQGLRAGAIAGVLAFVAGQTAVVVWWFI